MGLSTRWLAQRWDHPEQSVQRWERNRQLPAALVDDLKALREQFDGQVRALVAAAATEITVPRTDPDSTDGWPATWHRAVALQAAQTTHAQLVFAASGLIEVRPGGRHKTTVSGFFTSRQEDGGTDFAFHQTDLPLQELPELPDEGDTPDQGQ